MGEAARLTLKVRHYEVDLYGHVNHANYEHYLEAARVEALEAVPFAPNKPSLLLAHTVKGKGISFIENRVEWHYRIPEGAEVEQARRDLQ